MKDEEKQVLENISNKINNLDKKIDKNNREGYQITIAVAGFSIALAGIILWIQTGELQIETWSSNSNFLVFYGTLIMILAGLMYKRNFKKWIRIAFWVVLSILVLLVLTIIVLIICF